MPQLDTAAYLPQVFWLIVVFFAFYIIVLKNIVPTLSRILKVRSKKLIHGKDIVTEMQEENTKIAVEYDNIISNSIKESGELLQRTSNGAELWLRDSLASATSQKAPTDATEFNGAYINAVAQLTAKKAILSKVLAGLACFAR